MNTDNKDKYVQGNMDQFEETKGYFLGRFMGEKGHPELATDEVEIAWKHLPTSFNEAGPHYHKGGVEVNIVISGSYSLIVNGDALTLEEKDFLVVYPQTTLQNLSAEEGTTLLVVKSPSIQDGKFDLMDHKRSL